MPCGRMVLRVQFKKCVATSGLKICGTYIYVSALLCGRQKKHVERCCRVKPLLHVHVQSVSSNHIHKMISPLGKFEKWGLASDRYTMVRK